MGLPGSVSFQYFDDTIFGYYRGNTIGFFGTISFDDPPFTIWAFDAKTGALKFNKNMPHHLATYPSQSQQEVLRTELSPYGAKNLRNSGLIA